MMKNLISSVTVNTFSYLRQLGFARFLAAILVVFLVLGTSINPAQAKEPIGERIGKQLHETSKNSERPKTTGEFLDEARGDIPLGERMKNITRDSGEALSQFGQGITTSVKEGARELGDNVK